MKLTYSYLNRTVHFYWVSLLMLLVVSFNTVVAAPPPVNSVIGNQAVATYTVAGGATQTSVSNLVQTIVLQIADFSMISDNALRILPSKEVVFTHQITNSSNGPDSFELVVAKADNPSSLVNIMELGNVAIYADSNGDGIADNTTPITRTPQLQPGSTFSFVIIGATPIRAALGEVATLLVTATSNFNRSITATNTDTATIVTGPVILVEKMMTNTTSLERERAKSAYPDDIIRIRLTYKNTGNAASFVELTDALDPGFEYVTNSARYVNGTTEKIITLADTTDVTLTPPTVANNRTISFKFTRPLPAEVALNPILSYVEFDVKIARQTLPKVITNIAEIKTGTTLDNITNSTGVSNAASIKILLQADFDINSVLALGSNPVTTVRSDTNFGTTTRTVTRGIYTDVKDTDIYANDTANYKFPAGTQFFLYDDNDTIPLTDTNGDAHIDTGPVDPILSTITPRFVYLRVVLPPDIITGADFNYRIKVIATSVNSGQEHAVYNVIRMVKSSTVDLVQLNGTTETGVGPGPGESPALSVSVDAGKSVDVNLRIKHSGAETVYRLEYSDDPSFSRVNTLQDGWDVTFYNGTTKEQIINSISVARTTRAANGSMTPVNYNFNASIKTPKGSKAEDFQIYFRVVSVRIKMSDLLFDRITINVTHELTLGDGQVGQVYEGSSVTYLHFLTNNGNVTETRGTVNVTSDPSTGWTAILYLDLDGDGKVSPGDPEFTNLSQLATWKGGFVQNAQVPILLVIQPLTGSGVGSENRTTIRVELTDTTHFTQVTDLTSVSSGFLTIHKMQLLDPSCNIAAPDQTGSFTSFNISAMPGQCIVYKVTITNTATESAVTAVNLTDKVPAFTTFDGTFNTEGYKATGTTPSAANVSLPPNGTRGSATNSSNTSVGNIVVKWASFAAKATSDIYYRVKVEN